MPLSVESQRGAFQRLVEHLKAMRGASVCVGDFSLQFAESVALILSSATELREWHKEAIRSLCALVRERPLPGLPLALLIERHLADRQFLLDRLELFLRDKRELRTDVAKVAATNAARIGLQPGARILVYGYSYIFPELFSGLPESIKETLQIWTPDHSRRAVSEGEFLKQALERDSALRVTVVSDQEALQLVQQQRIDTFVTSAKVVGLHAGNLGIMNTASPENLTRAAHAQGTTVLAITGRYKMWPRDLFSQQHDTLVPNTAADEVVPAEVITWFATEAGVFTPLECREIYEPWLAATMECYPGWESKDASFINLAPKDGVMYERSDKKTQQEKDGYAQPNDVIGEAGQHASGESTALPSLLEELVVPLIRLRPVKRVKASGPSMAEVIRENRE